MQATGAIKADRDQVLAFRIDSHNLARRLPRVSLLAAAGACGIQNTPPGSAELALHARVEGLRPDEIDRAVAADKSLLQAMSLRGAPHFFPVADAAVFSAGVLPEDEESIRLFIRGSVEGLDRAGISATGLIRLTAASLRSVLAGRAMTKDELGIAIADRISGELSTGQRAIWRSASWFVRGQTLGETLVRYALYVVSLQGTFCYAPRQDNRAYFVLTDEWLDKPLSTANHAYARSVLVRRYLHCYGPSTPGSFAEWAGISPSQADSSWALIRDELAEVDYEGQSTWLLQSDVRRYRSPVPAAGIRFLPPHDPLLQMRDRETLIPDRSMHRMLWRTVGNPGIVLMDGKPVAAWRSQKKGKTMNVTLEALADIPKKMSHEIEAEARSLAPYKDCAFSKIGLR